MSYQISAIKQKIDFQEHLNEYLKQVLCLVDGPLLSASICLQNHPPPPETLGFIFIPLKLIFVPSPSSKLYLLVLSSDKHILHQFSSQYFINQFRNSMQMHV
jgi:hypothetical protein